MPLHLVYGSQPALGTVTRTISTSTLVQRNWNATEQRGAGRMPLVNFRIPYDGITKADKDALRLDIAAAQGRAATNLSFGPFLGTTYTNLTLMRDEWEAVERTVGQYTTELQLRQTIPQALTAAGSLSAFPTLSAGVSCMLPFGQGDVYQTDVNDSPSGMRYTFPWFGASLSGFPTRELRRWPLSFPTLIDADLALIEQFFIGVNGRWLTFSFTDPDSGTTYTHCRFGQDELVVSHKRYGLSSIDSLVIEEFNA